MEKDPLVNRFISVPRDKGSLNCAVFVAGIIEAVLTGTGFVCYYNEIANVIPNDLPIFIACKSDSSLAQRYNLHGEIRGSCDISR